ncbi:uncharacterized protein LOC114356423 [Ostrinia furnacalis]|uniref:uncharacterized protein LOC114356423 n=1 Tax=Ostrinia furnacalis TaxID=93504 RepID=UPI00103E0CBF|nr:uncharacterized protein LOC114356423 [Ostrinia furnacalis]
MMLKCFTFLLLVAAAQALTYVIKEEPKASETGARASTVPAPTLEHLNTFLEPFMGTAITWSPGEGSNNILGYKVTSWIQSGSNNMFSRYQDVYAYGPGQTMAVVAPLYQYTWFRFVVQAFNSEGYSVESNAWRAIII